MATRNSKPKKKSKIRNPFKKKRDAVYFGKNKATIAAEEMIQVFLKYAPKVRQIMNNGIVESDGTIIQKMYDFFKSWDQTINRHRMDFDDTPLLLGESPMQQLSTVTDNRIVAKPVSVMHELETIPAPFSCDDKLLNDKIQTLKIKSGLVNQRYTKDQINGMCKRLENRKRYKEESAFYESFPNTNDDKIDLLLSRYKLEFNESDLFVPVFPKDAVTIMKDYTDTTLKLTGEAPVFYVIAEEKDFQKKREKLDPILLVQSPFGFYWQILGAWDKELLLLSEL